MLRVACDDHKSTAWCNPCSLVARPRIERLWTAPDAAWSMTSGHRQAKSPVLGPERY